MNRKCRSIRRARRGGHIVSSQGVYLPRKEKYKEKFLHLSKAMPIDKVKKLQETLNTWIGKFSDPQTKTK